MAKNPKLSGVAGGVAMVVGIAVFFALPAAGQPAKPGNDKTPAAKDVRQVKGTEAPAKAEETAPLDPQVDIILTRLQDRHVRDLHAKVEWESASDIEDVEDKDRKLGQIWYKEFDPAPKFLVHFQKKITKQKRDMDERHMFDGRWYIELQGGNQKVVTRREVRRAGDAVNPYKIGEGVFPLPFGQKKEDVLREFSVTRKSPEKDDPPNTDRLRLIPREGTRSAERYKFVDFWVARDGKYAGLPIKVLTSKKSGTGKITETVAITFSDIRLDEGFADNTFTIETPAGWEEVMETLDPVPPPPGVVPGKSGGP